MPWQCRLVDDAERREWAGAHPGEGFPVGWMWHEPAMVEGKHADLYLAHQLSNEYKRDWLGKRPPILVVLPPGWVFCVDERVTDASDGHGWQVSGEPPAITVTPSINAMGTYHGFLTAGVLSDDVEGRTYG